jgi:hypothetical protein
MNNTINNMNDVKILFYFMANDNSIFLELKRVNYKNCKDKSKYVSWFRIINNIPNKLNFIKMDENFRFFSEGKLILNETNNSFIENNENMENIINLHKTDINIDNIKLCFEYWNKI